jgi:bifunctional DNA-binding transcriptional regulator/antitoxin component of YhaV-PrlF toxin-antitoxin module
MKWATIPKPIKIWGTGQLTLPIEIRRNLDLEDSDMLTAFRAGEAIILTPKKLKRPGLAAAVQKEMKKKNITLKSLFEELEKERQHYRKEEGKRH